MVALEPVLGTGSLDRIARQKSSSGCGAGGGSAGMVKGAGKLLVLGFAGSGVDSDKHLVS